jgi:hypothetical protein
MLQRLGLKDTLFIAMSNYYYEEKASYLAALSESRANRHDLGSFLIFGLKVLDKKARTIGSPCSWIGPPRLQRLSSSS